MRQKFGGVKLGCFCAIRL